MANRVKRSLEWRKQMSIRQSKPITFTIDQKGCHICTSHVPGGDRPYVTIGGKRMVMSRYVYERDIGPIPPGIFVCHSCDTPMCINPDHFFLGTQKDNMVDASQKNRIDRMHSPRGESHGMTKLTNQEAISIRNDPRPSRAVAKEYGINKGTVLNIRNGFTWKHV